MNGFYQRRRESDNQDCPMTPNQVQTMLENQQQLMRDMADIKKYLFAGRVVIGAFVAVGLTLDWTRDHITFLRAWILK